MDKGLLTSHSGFYAFLRHDLWVWVRVQLLRIKTQKFMWPCCPLKYSLGCAFEDKGSLPPVWSYFEQYQINWLKIISIYSKVPDNSTYRAGFSVSFIIFVESKPDCVYSGCCQFSVPCQTRPAVSHWPALPPHPILSGGWHQTQRPKFQKTLPLARELNLGERSADTLQTLQFLRTRSKMKPCWPTTLLKWRGEINFSFISVKNLVPWETIISNEKAFLSGFPSSCSFF